MHKKTVNKKWTKRREDTQDVYVENPTIVGNTTTAHRLQNNHYERNTMGKHKGNDLLRPFFATQWLQWRQWPLSLSVSFSLSTQLRSIHIQLQNVQQPTTIFALCHIYTHITFRAIYTYGPKRLTNTHLHMCPLPIGREDHHRAWDHPVLLSFPSGGTFSQHTWVRFLHSFLNLNGSLRGLKYSLTLCLKSSQFWGFPLLDQ